MSSFSLSLTQCIALHTNDTNTVHRTTTHSPKLVSNSSWLILLNCFLLFFLNARNVNADSIDLVRKVRYFGCFGRNAHYFFLFLFWLLFISFFSTFFLLQRAAASSLCCDSFLCSFSFVRTRNTDQSEKKEIFRLAQKDTNKIATHIWTRTLIKRYESRYDFCITADKMNSLFIFEM